MGTAAETAQKIHAYVEQLMSQHAAPYAEPAPLPTCSECKWSYHTDQAFCSHQTVMRFHDPVNGVKKQLCSTERDRACPDHPCGHAGRLFQPRG